LRVLEPHRKIWDGHLGTVAATPHRIEVTAGSKPVHCQPYRAGSSARSAEKEEIDRMIAEQLIEPATCEWASPIVLVLKPDGSLRFCVDYRRLNAINVPDTYPLPRMDECIDSLGDAVVFTTLGCNSGYWQIPVHPTIGTKLPLRPTMEYTASCGCPLASGIPRPPFRGQLILSYLA
jgi:hypothetical protein